MKRQIATSLAIALTTLCFGQTDTIFTNNEKIPCAVQEITPEAVKFKYPGEDVMNSMYRNTVQKIVFKSGRVQTFAESTTFKKIKGVDDYENVSVTQVEGEVRGLFKLGDVSSKAKGTTTLSNQERVKERAYRKLKIVAAMMGANIVYITNQRSDGNKMGGYYQSGSSAETNLTGVAYTNQLPSADEFKALIGDRKNFRAVEEAKLWSSASDMSKSEIQSYFVISNVTVDNGIITIDADLQGETKYTKFRVVSFDKEYFNVYYADKSTSYNIKIRVNL